MPSTKAVLDSRHAQEILNDVFKLYRSYGNPSTTPTTAELQKVFSPHLKIISNDRNVCNNLNDFVKRLQEIQKQSTLATYSNLLETPIVAGNKIVIRYGAELTRKTGKKSQFQVIAILTLQDDKIVEWTEVLHERGSGSFDA